MLHTDIPDRWPSRVLDRQWSVPDERQLATASDNSHFMRRSAPAMVGLELRDASNAFGRNGRDWVCRRCIIFDRRRWYRVRGIRL